MKNDLDIQKVKRIFVDKICLNKILNLWYYENIFMESMVLVLLGTSSV